jgi:DNA polymerase III alpha subunit
MGFYAPHVLIGDARRHKLQVLRAGINSSASGCKPVPVQAATASGGAFILGLSTVRGIGDDLAKAIVAERDAHGPYRSLPDLLRRTGMPRQAAQHLITIGALAEFGLGRRELLWQLRLLLPAVAVGAPSRERRARVQNNSHSLPTERGRSPSAICPTGNAWLPTTACSVCRPAITRSNSCARICRPIS